MSTALTLPKSTLVGKYNSLSQSLSRVRGEVKDKESEIDSPLSVTNLKNGVAILGGGTACGALEGMVGETVKGIPVDLIAAIATTSAGVASGSTSLYYAGMAMASARLKDTARKAVSGAVAKPAEIK